MAISFAEKEESQESRQHLVSSRYACNYLGRFDYIITDQSDFKIKIKKKTLCITLQVHTQITRSQYYSAF